MKPDPRKLMQAMQEVAELRGDTLKLPMPRRIALPCISMIKEVMFGDLWPWVAAECAKDQSKLDIMAKMESSPTIMAQLKSAGLSLESMHITLIALRHQMQKAPILTVSEGLSALLADTNISDNVPAKFFTPSFKTSYIEFNAAEFRQNAKLRVDDAGILSACEGCYIQEHTYDRPPKMSLNALNSLELDSRKPVRVIDIGFTASPFNNPNLDGIVSKAYAAYDGMSFATIYIQDEEESIKEIMERHFQYFRDGIKSNPLLSPEHAVLFEEIFSENFSFVCKVLFYLHIERKDRVTITEAADLERRIAAVADKKKDKLKRQLNRVYDHIIVGPKTYVPLNQRIEVGNLPKGTKTPHYRSMTIGIRWTGSGADKKASLVRIKESLINKHLLTSDSEATVRKNYVIH